MFEGVGRRSAERGGSFLDLGQNSLNGYERNALFRNDGDGRFTDVGWVDGADRIEDGRALSVFDADRDGRLDLLLQNYLQPAVFLANRGPARRWIALHLVGVRSNRDAIGARVRLRTARRWQTREVHAGSGYLSGQSLVQHFGLGDADGADEVRIDWPSGTTTVLHDLPADRVHVVVEGAAAPVVHVAGREVDASR